MDDTVSAAQAAKMLGYRSRGTVYARIKAGDLDSELDSRGRRRVTVESIRDYLANPPAGSWSREKAAAPEGDAPDVSLLLIENARLRETVTRLQMAREKESAARNAQAAANRHLRKALRKETEATALTAEASAELDDLLVQFLIPDTPEDATRGG